MKVVYYTFLLFLGLFLHLYPKDLHGRTIEVCSQCKVKTIHQAINKAKDGDVIEVKKGTYKVANVTINKSLILRAEKGVVIDGENKGDVFIITADHVTLDGFKIINVGRSNLEDFAAVNLKDVEKFTIKNLVIIDPFFGIFLNKSNNGVVKNNTVLGQAKSEFNAGNGIHLWYSHHNKIQGNKVNQMRDGIYFEFSNHCIIQNNQSKNNVRYGLHFMFSNNNMVKNDLFSSNGAGIAIMFSNDMKMMKNTFKNNWGSAAYGVLLKEVYDATISFNKFERNTTALNVEGCNRINYTHNDFIQNGWAINARGGNYKNVFTKNNFINNSFDLAFHGTINENSFTGNYWSSYTGYDIDKDGIGDVPYRPVKLFSHFVQKTPESIVLLRSLFVDLMDFAEKVSPVITPDKLTDNSPYMKIINHDRN